MKPAPITPIRILDYPTRIKLQNQRLLERKEEARRDMARISYLWASAAFQKAHTEDVESGEGA